MVFFGLVALFIWIAVVPPEGMSKYPVVDVEFEYSKQAGTATVQVDIDSSFEEEQE